ncbi:MAG: leucyl/phenylalanyl-tRNA--protein transferase [Oligoflexales bacterium]
MQASELSPHLLLTAYSNGYFPMPENDGEILWYRPDPRAIIPLEKFHVSKSLQKHMRKHQDTITINTAFQSVMKACGDREETWIQNDIIRVYTEMYQLGHAHSLEVWRNEHLIGGTYGLQIGGAFFAESMFHYETNASKVALYHLTQTLTAHRFKLLECQFLTPHLASLGAIEVSDETYINDLEKALQHQEYTPLS